MTLDDLLPFVMPTVNGCPEIMAVQHLRLAARRFCMNSLTWRATLDPITTDGTSTDYDLIPDDDTEIIKLIEVASSDSTSFEVVDPQRARALLRSTNCGNYVWTTDRRSMTINWSPLAGTVLTVQVALQPTMAALDIPDDLGSRYGETLAHGAISSLLMLPKKDWSDTSLAAIHKAMFDDETSSAAVMTSLGNGSSRPRVRAYFT